MIVQGDVMKYTDNQIAAIEHFKACLVLPYPEPARPRFWLDEHNGLSKRGGSQSILSIVSAKCRQQTCNDVFVPCAGFDRRSSMYILHDPRFFLQHLARIRQRRGLHRRVIEGDRTYNKSSALRRLYYELHRQPMTDLQLEDFLSVYSYLKTQKNMETYQRNQTAL